ncbi:MAG: TonB-dependent receptor [Brevundimonas sp.]|uniref:TonB-dependent receptor plug domain-containing protein n=1 Tax=Brevundimonas sp. TaxID=1871086 RepID=UPI0025B845BD|nr:TonB-dependent receptor [Brevundimonas sp.]MBX3478109.1 TonB-dependent receptor [Brevundimonas sp.]
MKTALCSVSGLALALSLAASPVLAQSAPAAPPPSADGRGVLAFEPAFFAEAAPNTVLDMLNRLPGFSLESGDSSTRGYAGAGGNVLVDGQRPAIKSEGLESYLRRISASSVARIELIRGGAPGIDMQGRPVIANVVLHRTASVERVVEISPYLYPDGYIGPLIRGQYTRREGETSREFAFSATSDKRVDLVGDGFRRRYDPAGALIQDARLDLNDLFQNVSGSGALQQPLAGGRLRLNGMLSYNNSENGQSLTILSGAGEDERSDQFSEGLNGEIGISWSRRLGPRTELELTGLQRSSTGEDRSVFTRGGFQSVFTADETEGESIVRALTRFRANDRWAFEGGGEVAYNVLDSTTTYAENGVFIALPSASVKVEELRAEAFGQATWRPRDNLTIEAGLRVEVSEISQSGDSDRSKSFVYPKPRVQLTWTPGAGHQLRLSYERQVGQLDFGDFVASSEVDLGQVTAGNPDLVPDKTDAFEIVYERRFWNEAVLELLAAHVEIKDFVGIIPLVGGFDAVGNIGDGTMDQGQVKLTLPLDRLGVPNARFQARATWSHSEITDPVTGETVAFPGNDGFGCGVAFNQDLRGGRWSYGFDHGCDRDAGYNYRTRELRRTDKTAFIMVYGQWKPRPDLTVRLEVGNADPRILGRERWVYAGNRDTAPLSFHEVQETSSYPWFWLQFRKTL